MTRLPYAAVFLVALFALVPPAGAQAPTRDGIVRGCVERGERTWRNAQDPGRYNPGSRDLFSYALALCEAGQHLDRVETLFDVAARMQQRDAAQPGYGNFRWSWTHEGVLDANAVDFCVQGGALLWLRHRDRLSPAARGKLRELLEFGIEGSLRHRVAVSYTNIVFMNAGNLILLGEGLEKPEVADEGYRRLERACVYVARNGVHEYVSPTYYGVDLEDLQIIEAFCRRESGRQMAAALLELLWTDVAANWYPPAQKLAGARSRDYDYLRGLGYLDSQLWAAGWLPGQASGLAVIWPTFARWQPPARLRALSERYPRLVRQSWGESAQQTRTHYVLRDVTLSTAGAGYGTMDMPLTVDFPGERTGVRGYFIADGRHDPYGKLKIQAGAAHQKTLHLTPFFAGTQRRGDALALALYRDRDVPAGTRTLESHFVLPRAVDAFWVGDRRIPLPEQGPLTLPLPPGDALVVRNGTAAVGIKVPWARGLDGRDAPAALVYDGNDFGAVRLTVDHHAFAGEPAATANAAAALWVRVGGGLATDAAFERWRRSFGAARAEVAAAPDRVRLSARGVEGTLALATEAPYAGCSVMEPKPVRAVLEIDGKDVGREILKRLEIVRKLPDGPPTGPLLSLSPGRSLAWEAESGGVEPYVEVAKDGQASGGGYVWMPGEPGAKGGGAGSITWRLKVPKAGTYYLWGRVLAPTPDDDSFYVHVLKGGLALLDRASWPTGTHAAWEWVRAPGEDGKEPLPLALPSGEVTLQISVREDGTRLDRLFLTPDREGTPEGR